MKLHDTGVYLVNGVPQTSAPAGVTEADAKKGTIAYGILKAHNTGDSMQDLRMKFDSMTSHDITYVGIIQTRSEERRVGNECRSRWSPYH